MSANHPSGSSERLFALLLFVYPRRFRQAFAAELLAFFREDRRRAALGGRSAVARFWFATVADLLGSALRQRCGRSSHGASRPHRPATREVVVSGLLFDLRFAFRSLARSPVFCGVAVTTLALGMGATTAILSVVDGVLLRPLPYPDAERLVSLGGVFRHDPEGLGPLSAGNLQDARNLTATLDRVAASNDVSMTLLGSGDPELVEAAEVTEGFLELFGAELMAGRGFASRDFDLGAPRTAILEHGFWATRWGGDPNVLGSTIVLDGDAFTVVGVVSPRFRRPEAVWSQRDAQMWVAWQWDWRGAADRERFGYQGVGRLAPGATVAAASEEVDAIFRASIVEHGLDSDVGGRVEPLRDRTLGSIGEPLRLLLAAAGFVLLIACANVANLMLARGTVRAREVALRTALGADRYRMVRQLLTEAVVLALIAGAFGAVIAYWSVEAFKAVSPGGIPRLAEVSVDTRVLGISFLLATATGLLFGLAPIVQANRSSPAQELKESAGPATSGRGGGRARSALVVAEIGLALVLLIGAGLLTGSFLRLSRVEPGFEPDGLMSMRLRLRAGYPDPESWGPFYADLVGRVAAIPGVNSASLTTSLPFSGVGVMSTLTPIGSPEHEARFVTTTYVTPGHFENMGMRWVEGRDFSAADRDGAPLVAVVNEEFRDHSWPGATTVLGRRVKMGSLDEDAPSAVVIGVVNALRYRPDQAPSPEIYFSARQKSWRAMTVVVRTEREPEALEASMRRAVWELDPDLAIDRVVAVSDLARAAVLQPRFYSLLAASFAAVAMALALIGVYGTISYSTGRRTREIGIRVALGARPGRVIGLVVGAGFRLAVMGIALGLLAAYWLMTLLGNFLFGITTTDPRTFLIAALSFSATAAVTSYLPARRAARVDPVGALRDGA